MTIKWSVASKSVQLKFFRGGANVLQENEKKQQTTSRRIDCPFLLSGNVAKKTGKWSWRQKSATTITNNHLTRLDIQFIESSRNVVYKNILWTWHYNNNILAYWKKCYEVQETFDAFMQVWNILVSSTSEEDYEKQVSKLARLLSEKPEVLKYVTETWLVSKKHFWRLGLISIPHFGSRSSSRAEEAHAYMKKFLQVSIGHFLTVYNKLKIALDHQIKAEMDRRSHASFAWASRKFCTGKRKNLLVCF